ncbi:hypothetical protein PV325_008234 [Microctonus aethiopoides]|uniref:COX assembly mitochondrial protein n=1 Tax=Microctonus aethiopoides TaxID=144406 RepID=A0AA39FMS6_9HYME|nr:hypothetical protein PV325_008234 [Microctonus aethiopoides]KAK0095578.1 hypothetical protein PV326_007947 [Microctonus aethiopoides]KAK0172514.1 hypothetical protein PV328_005822 [Microctonus aethiopoides]
MAENQENCTVLPDKYSSGPHGLGDPDDKTLRKIEKNVLIPKILRERSQKEKCAEEVKGFYECAKDAGLLVVFSCRKENLVMRSCLQRWFHDENFIADCTNQYLDQRSEYRRTGIGAKYQKRKEPALL